MVLNEWRDPLILIEVIAKRSQLYPGYKKSELDQQF